MYIYFILATLRSGYMLQDPSQFASNIDTMMRKTLGITDEEIEDEVEEAEVIPETESQEEEDEEATAEKDEL